MIVTRLPGSRYGSARSNTVLTTLKIAVFAPMPSARVAMTIAVKAGLLRSRRRLYAMSRKKASMSDSERGAADGSQGLDSDERRIVRLVEVATDCNSPKEDWRGIQRTRADETRQEFLSAKTRRFRRQSAFW